MGEVVHVLIVIVVLMLGCVGAIIAPVRGEVGCVLGDVGINNRRLGLYLSPRSQHLDTCFRH